MSYGTILLYYRRGEDFSLSLDDVLRQSIPPQQVVVVDNGSGDGIISRLKLRYPEVTFVDSPTNLGYAGGMNLGAANLRRGLEWTLYLTHEVRLANNCVEEMLGSPSNARESTQAVGPVLRTGHSEKIWSAGGTFGSYGTVAHSVMLPPEKFAKVAWLDGSCVLARTLSMSIIGGFDEDYFLYWEDVDLGVRLAEIGPVYVARDARASQSTAKTPVYYGARNQILFWRKRRRPDKVVAASARQLVKTLLRDFPKMAFMKTRILGVADGFSGRLRTIYGSLREEK